MPTPRGLKSARNIKNKGLIGTTEVVPWRKTVRKWVFQQPVKPALVLTDGSNAELKRLLRNRSVPTGLESIFPLYPALRLRLRAGLRLFRACSTGFAGSCSTVAWSHWVS